MHGLTLFHCCLSCYRHLQRQLDSCERAKGEVEKEVQGLRDRVNYETGRAETYMRTRSSWDGPGSTRGEQRTSPKGARSGSKSPGRRSADPKSPRRRSGSKSPGRRGNDPKSPRIVPSEGVSTVQARSAVTARERDLDMHSAYTPNVVRRARLKEAQQQQQLAALKQSVRPDIINTQLSYSKGREHHQPHLHPQHHSPGTGGGAEGRTEYYAEDPFSILYGDDDEFSHSASSPGFHGNSPLPLPLPPPAPTPASYPSRAAYIQAPPLVEQSSQPHLHSQSTRSPTPTHPTPSPSQGPRVPMSESAVADIMQAAQRRMSQRGGDLVGSPTNRVQVPPRRESLSVASIPASLESSIADLADIMYALGAAKSSITKETPHRRRSDSTPYSPGGSDTYSVHSKETDSPN